MKKRLLAVLLAVIVVVLTVSLSSAAGLPGTGYWFGATHQNVGDGTATIVVTAYDQASGVYPHQLAPLLPGASANVIPSDIPNLPAGFIGSIVTSSDQPLVALVNITNRPVPGFGDPNGKAAALYSGVDGSNAATSLLFPLAKHNSFDKTTTFYLQNAGTAAATIQAVFAFQGVNYTYTSPSIAPGRMIAVDPGMTTPPVPSGDGKVGAMTATSAQPIAGTMLEHEVGFPVGLVMQGSSGFAPAELGQTAYCPIYKKHHFGRSSGLQVQNAHNVAQNFTINYIAIDGSPYQTVVTNVAPGASVTLLNDASITDPLDTLLAATVTGSAGPVAAVMNESQLPLPPGVQQTATTHNCQAASTASNTLAYPAYKETRFGRQNSIQIQNVGGAVATNVVLVFKDNLGNTRTTLPQTINPGASKVFLCVSGTAGLWNGSPLAVGTLSGVTVTADQPIIAVVNEASWSSASPCLPDNGPTSFDKTTSNTFNIDN